ncbi:MAG: hypothetical protein KC422_13720 [Trueperaceae bacterium]|nr:hypothetical protein [Trueperaceae bacterium]
MTHLKTQDLVTSPPITIVFIGGFGRSGSTLTDLILGSGSNTISVGELRYMWERGLRDNQLCGCGAAFHDCPFWSEVLALSGHAGLAGKELEHIINLQKRVDMAKYVPQLATKVKSSSFQTRYDEFSDHLVRLYQAIAQISGKDTIIDSSKHFSYGYLLAGLENFTLKVAHLIRDSRASAYSWSKKVERPEIHWKKELMPRYSLTHSALEWSLSNLLTEGIKFMSPVYKRYKYEELMDKPELFFQMAGDLGVKDIALEQNLLSPKESHTVAGNPMRFKKQIEVRGDYAWQQKMTPAHFRFITAATSAVLLRYGYPLTRPGIHKEQRQLSQT